MNAIVKKIESKYGKLPLLYKEWISNYVPFKEAYNQSDYLQWCDPKEIFNKSYNVFENDLRDGLLLIGVCGQEAFWYLDMRFDNRVLIWQNDEADLYAPSLEGWIFRVCLDLAGGFYEEEKEDTIDSIKNLINLISKANPNWYKCIIDGMKNSLRQLNGFEYFIKQSEAEDIIAKEFGTEYLNETIKVLK